MPYMIVLIILLSDSNAACVVYTCSHTLIVLLNNIFDVSPTSVNVTLGGTAEFHCQLRADVVAIPGWEINGVPPNESLGQLVHSEGALFILTINGVVLNRTNVSYIARWGNRTLGTAYAEILLQGK